MAKKQYKNFDSTSAGMARHLDDLRERNKKRAQAKKRMQSSRDRTSLSRGGFR